MAGATIWNLVYIRAQLNEMMAEQRPWLKAAPTIVGPLSAKAGLLYTTVKISVNNVGHLPASGTKDAAVIVNSDDRDTVTDVGIREVCNRAEYVGGDKNSEAITVFPGDSGEVIVKDPDQRSVKGEHTMVTPGESATVRKYLMLIFCVSYFAAGDDSSRHTGGTLSILGKKIGPVLEDGASIDASDLSLSKLPFSSAGWRSYAD
jgi:hypothetical protein